MTIAFPLCRALLLAFALSGPVAALAQETAAETAAEAALPAALDPGAPEGAELTARTDSRFDRYMLPFGRYTRAAPDARELEGRVIRSAFRLAGPEATTASVMAGYRERLAALGYEPVFACETTECGGFDFRFAVELLPPPAMLLDASDFAQLSARREGGADEVHVSVLVSRLLGAVYIQTVVVAPAGPDAVPAPSPDPDADAMPAAPGLQDGAEAALLEQLTRFGHVRLQRLAFEPASAALTAGSAAAIDVAARALAARPELAVLIVGHSDNQGPLADNVALSRRRAETVREALIARGVAAGRLEAHGAGFLAPVSTNATEEGRALNRRVELVLR